MGEFSVVFWWQSFQEFVFAHLYTHPHPSAPTTIHKRNHREKLFMLSCIDPHYSLPSSYISTPVPQVTLAETYCTHSQAALASLGNMLEIEILRPHPRPTESDTLGVGPRYLCFNKTFRWFWCVLMFENHWLSVYISTFFCAHTTLHIHIYRYRL